jgi:pyruvate dehydrogenase E1 component alpha subunit/2-oxoisovalerate dehydrogenase E1 component alpha subunit
MVVARLLRLCGHGEHDDASYIDPQLKSSPVGRDCLKVAEQQLLAQGWADNIAINSWRGEATNQVEDAVSSVQREAPPDPYRENWCAFASKHLVETHPEIP